MANFRKYPRALPHTRQRLYRRTANFGVLFALLMRDFFAILLLSAPSLAPEGHAEEPQQLPTLRIGLGRGDNGNGQTFDTLHLVVVYFGENHLFFDTQRIIPTPIEGIARHATKIAYTG